MLASYLVGMTGDRLHGGSWLMPVSLLISRADRITAKLPPSGRHRAGSPSLASLPGTERQLKPSLRKYKSTSGSIDILGDR